MPSTPESARTLRARKRMERIDRAAALLLEEHDDVPLDTPEIIKKLREEFGVCLRTAYEDLAAAWHKHAAANQQAHEARMAEADRSWRRRVRLADKRGDTQAGNFALDRLHKLHGLYAPKKVEISGSVGVHGSLDVKLDAIIGILDAEGQAALEVVMLQIERARASGLLAAPAPEAADDAEDAVLVPATEPTP